MGQSFVVNISPLFILLAMLIGLSTRGMTQSLHTKDTLHKTMHFAKDLPRDIDSLRLVSHTNLYLPDNTQALYAKDGQLELYCWVVNYSHKQAHIPQMAIMRHVSQLSSPSGHHVLVQSEVVQNQTRTTCRFAMNTILSQHASATLVARQLSHDEIYYQLALGSTYDIDVQPYLDLILPTY